MKQEENIDDHHDEEITGILDQLKNIANTLDEMSDKLDKTVNDLMESEEKVDL